MSASDKSHTYRWRDRRSDRRNARRDGGKRIPTYNDVIEMIGANGEITTPYVQGLQDTALDMIATMLQNHLRQTAEETKGLGGLRAQRATAVADLERATDLVGVAEVLLTEDEMWPRSSIETRTDQREVVRSRRVADRARRIANAHGGESAAHDHLGQLDIEIARTEEAIRTQFVLTQAQAKQVSARVARRAAAYWEHLAIAHPDGSFLAPMIRYTSQVLPSWVLDPADGPAESLGRGEYRLVHLVARLKHAPADNAEADARDNGSPDEYEEPA